VRTAGAIRQVLLPLALLLAHELNPNQILVAILSLDEENRMTAFWG
jgi:hypothetical protein